MIAAFYQFIQNNALVQCPGSTSRCSLTPPDPKTLTVTVSFRLFQEETSFMKSAMDKVQSSYLRSLQEVGELLKKRAETIKNLKIWTRSLPTVTVTIRPPSAPFTSSGSTSQLSLTCKYCVLLAAPTIPDQTDPLRPQHISQSLYVSFLSGFLSFPSFFCHCDTHLTHWQFLQHTSV